jgi:Zinc finger, ZZ type
MTIIEDPVHNGIECASCHTYPIIGVRFHCASCPSGADFCGICEERGLALLPSTGLGHTELHVLIKIAAPLDRNVTMALVNSLAAVQRRLINQAQGYSGANGMMLRPPGVPPVRQITAMTTTNGWHANVAGVLDQPMTCCSECSKDLIGGPRYLCANCPLARNPSGQVGYSLCQACEVNSLLLHDPTHFFVKISRSMSNAVLNPAMIGESLLPPLYRENENVVAYQRASETRQTTRSSAIMSWMGLPRTQEFEMKRFNEMNLVPLQELIHP